MFDVCETDLYKLTCEVNEEDKVFLHMDIKKWSPESYKRMLEDWVEILDSFYVRNVEYLYASLGVKDKKKHKLVSAFGMEPVGVEDDLVLFRIEV